MFLKIFWLAPLHCSIFFMKQAHFCRMPFNKTLILRIFSLELYQVTAYSRDSITLLRDRPKKDCWPFFHSKSIDMSIKSRVSCCKKKRFKSYQQNGVIKWKPRAINFFFQKREKLQNSAWWSTLVIIFYYCSLELKFTRICV